MTIEPTDEMHEAAFLAAEEDGLHLWRDTSDAIIRAVLEVVNRDYPATEYTLSALPEDDSNGMLFRIVVAYRGRGLWAVSRHRYCLGRSGEWDHESVPSERTDEWLAEHRFPLDEALRLAREELPKLRVNGMSAAEVQAWAERQRATPPQ